MALIPFIKVAICALLLTTSIIFMAGIARIHMVVMGFLSIGLLVSISMFQRAWDDVQKSRGKNVGGGVSAVAGAGKEPEKTD